MRALVTAIVLSAAGCAAAERPVDCVPPPAGPMFVFASCDADGRTEIGYEGENPFAVVGYWLPVCDETWSGHCGEAAAYDSDLDVYQVAEGGTSVASGASGVRPMCTSVLAEPTCTQGRPRCVFVPCDGEWHYGAAR